MADDPGYHVYTTFHIKGNDKEIQLPMHGLPDFAIGSGIIWSDGKRYRVVDSWFSIDHHGYLNDGTHIFLEPCKGADDRPRKMAPDYYERDPADRSGTVW